MKLLKNYINLMFIIPLVLGCKSVIPNEPIDPNDQDGTLEIFADKSHYFPLDVVKLFVQSDETLDAEQYSGKCGAENITAVKIDENSDTLIFLMPNVSGEQEIMLNINGKTAKTSIFVQGLPSVENPDEIISNLQTEFNNMIADLNDLSDTLLNADNRQLIGEMTAEFNSIMAQMSPADKQLFAQYWQQKQREAQEHLEQSGYYQAGIMRAPADEFERITIPEFEKLKEFGDFIGSKLIPISINGFIFAVSLTAPDPTFLTKAIALASGLILVKQLNEIKSKVLTLFNETVIPDNINVYIQNAPYNAPMQMVVSGVADVDYDVENGVWLYIPNKMVFRTICAADISSEIIYVKNIAGYIKEFQKYWNRMDNLITTLLSKFGFGGNLSGKPKTLESVSNYTTQIIEVKLPTNAALGAGTKIYNVSQGNIAFLNSGLGELGSSVRLDHIKPNGDWCDNLDEHYTTFLLELTYQFSYEYADKVWTSISVRLHSPAYTVRLHCPDRNPPETE